MSTPEDGTETRAFQDADHLDAWLSARPAPHPGLWVKVGKKGSGVRSVSAGDVNDVALCHGWITGNRRRLDETYFLQRITPRRPGSDWSMVNVRRVEELNATGRMRAGGLAEVAAAKADGRWAAAYESQREATVPEDLATALEHSPRARRSFERLGKTDRYLVILGLLKARTPQTRAARLKVALATLETDETDDQPSHRSP
ncbi:YdeI/OmpD-associated family protein [Streptomyces sp. DSM 40750]|uniref:YdeI/OmpD-associated family protein n=1 Tax=Streptomyces sp. DSM 40750 TaxID=2801030 RepID=UPI00214B72B1|nr:YdeI/OmpD-associated family protein [Streptomyces sp. DSM 40750]UUU25130.1 YdeI/OmpD-associated family protein [Streptomyces sp. DSM 40750]